MSGGGGAVFRVIDCNLLADLDPKIPSPDEEKLRRSYRALKVPRPHVEKGRALADSLRDEISRITSLTHRNVVSLHAKGQIDVSLRLGPTKWPWYIMSYIHEAVDLHELCKSEPPKLSTLVKYLLDTGIGLEYVHRNDLVHCDVKPHNIFVSREPDPRTPNAAVLADFGYTKSIRETVGETTVGFTRDFAHPELQRGSLVSSQGSRTFKNMARAKIRPAFDLFALGMSIHYLLESFYRHHHVYQKYGYEIKYLKLCAARLLDGLNLKIGIGFGALPHYCFSDYSPRGQPKVPGLRYTAASQFVEDMNKLLGMQNPEFMIPELLNTRRENIQVSDSAPVVYSERLRRVVDHPLVRRLASTTQLGLVSLVYPGGTHSRLEHSLGTFGVTSRYVNSLYNDTLNPIFKQLVTTKDMKITLLAALLHDIGQYPIAHDLEDVSLEFFSHENFGDRLLSTDHPVPPQARLFPELEIETADLARDLDRILKEYWGVALEDVRSMLAARSNESKKPRQIGSHIERLCKSLLDGPTDADKVDYLQRDARHCNVQYGYGIDVNRLFKCLTVASHDVNQNHLLLVMGVHEKGRISAESLLFVRYAMLTQIYWHHTMRAIKALLHCATAEFLVNIPEGKSEGLRDEFFRCAVLEEPFSNSEWNRVLVDASAVGSIHPGDLRVMGWLWIHTTSNGRSAIEHILNRRMFKRILTVYKSEDLTPKHQRVLDRVYSSENSQDRVLLREAIEEALMIRLRGSECPSALLETRGFTPEEWRERLQDLSKLRCVVDYPTARKGAAFGLQVVRQWGDRPLMEDQKHEERAPTEEYPRIIGLEHFSDGMKELEKSIACLRVYWTPSEQAIVKEALGNDEAIRALVLDVIARFRPGAGAA